MRYKVVPYLTQAVWWSELILFWSLGSQPVGDVSHIPTTFLPARGFFGYLLSRIQIILFSNRDTMNVNILPKVVAQQCPAGSRTRHLGPMNRKSATTPFQF